MVAVCIVCRADLRPSGRVLKTVGRTSLFLFSIYLINTYVLFLYGE